MIQQKIMGDYNLEDKPVTKLTKLWDQIISARRDSRSAQIVDSQLTHNRHNDVDKNQGQNHSLEGSNEEIAHQTNPLDRIFFLGLVIWLPVR